MAFTLTHQIDNREIIVEVWTDDSAPTTGTIKGLHVEVVGHTPADDSWDRFDTIDEWDAVQDAVDLDSAFHSLCWERSVEEGEAPDENYYYS